MACVELTRVTRWCVSILVKRVLRGTSRVTAASDDLVRQAAGRAAQSWVFTAATADGTTRPANANILLACQSPGAIPPADFTGHLYAPGNGVTTPVVIFKVDPEFTEQARMAKYQGSVVLSLIVEPSGKPTNIQVTRKLGYGLDEQAVDAMKQWRFKPAVKDGKPVRVRANVEMTFKLL